MNKPRKETERAKALERYSAKVSRREARQRYLSVARAMHESGETVERAYELADASPEGSVYNMFRKRMTVHR